jgi:hypothetical protein
MGGFYDAKAYIAHNRLSSVQKTAGKPVNSAVGKCIERRIAADTPPIAVRRMLKLE